MNLKFRYSVGTAGNRPNFSAQYETYNVSGGSITPVTLGNKELKPENVTEHEMGVDALFGGRFSLDLTYARTRAEDQIQQAPSLAFTGFQSQWRNAGTLKSNTWEASLGAQVIRSQNFTWNARLLFDRTRQRITKLNVPAYQTGVGGQGLGNVFYYREGEELGTFYGFQFAENCGHLPEGMDCSEFQVNDDGYLVWVGNAGSWENGWDTYTDEEGAQKQWWGTVAPFSVRGLAVRWGVPFQAEGNDPVTGDRTTFLPLGKGMPDYTFSLGNTFTYKNLSVYGLFEAVQGMSVYNQPLQWATFQAYSGIMDESGEANQDLRKPMGYYSALYGASGLQASSAFVDDASFIELREVSVSYRFSNDQLSRFPIARSLSALTLSACRPQRADVDGLRRVRSGRRLDRRRRRLGRSGARRRLQLSELPDADVGRPDHVLSGGRNTMKKRMIFALAAVTVFGTTACLDLDISNPNQADAERALRTAGDIEALIGGAIQHMADSSSSSGGIGPILMTMAYRALGHSRELRHGRVLRLAEGSRARTVRRGVFRPVLVRLDAGLPGHFGCGGRSAGLE